MPITHYLTCFSRDNASIMCVDLVFGSPIIQSVISGSRCMPILTPSPANEIMNASSTEGTKTYHCVNARASPKSKEIDHSQRFHKDQRSTPPTFCDPRYTRSIHSKDYIFI